MIKNNDLTFGQKFKIFMKKNGFALAVAGCAILLIVALTITAVIKNNQNKLLNVDISGLQEINETNPDSSQTAPVSSDNAIIYVMPIKNFEVGQDFTNTSLVYNETMNEWTTHQGVDFITQEMADVFACSDGTVESVKYSALEGNVVTINHDDGVKSVYKSLGQNVYVVAGDRVAAGDVIGQTSNSASSEARKGSHLHLEMYRGDVAVNPFEYFGDK